MPQGHGESCMPQKAMRVYSVKLPCILCCTVLQAVMFADDVKVSKGMVKYACGIPKESIVDVGGILTCPEAKIESATQKDVSDVATGTGSVYANGLVPLQCSVGAAGFKGSACSRGSAVAKQQYCCILLACTLCAALAVRCAAASLSCCLAILCPGRSP